MGATVALGNVVGEAQHILVVAIVPPQGAVDGDAILLAMDHDRLFQHRLLGAVEITHEGRNAALVEQFHVLGLDTAPVGQKNAHAGIEEGQFAQAMFQRAEIELGLGEGAGARQEAHLGAAAARRIAKDLQPAIGRAMGEGNEMFLAIAENRQLEPDRQGVDHRHADAMEPARHLVGILVEFAAGVELGHDDFGSRALGVLVVVVLDGGGNAAAIVGDRARAIGIERHGHPVGIAGERFVDGVVDDFIDHMVQARAIIGIADIHAGALPHRVEAFQHLDRISAVFGLALVLVVFGHSRPATSKTVPASTWNTAPNSPNPPKVSASVPVIQA